MLERVLGFTFFAIGLVALWAGFQIVALVASAIGLLLVASTARSGDRRNMRRGGGSIASFGSDTRYSDNAYIDSSGQCDVGAAGGGAGDCGGSDGGGGGGD
jgi:hypothetical protein